MIDFWTQPFGAIRSLFGSRFSGLFNLNTITASTQFNSYHSDKEKLCAVLANPALLKVFALQCDLFSMGEVCVEQNEKKIEDDPFLLLLKKPNPMPGASKSQFLWDFMFWQMMGTAYCYVDSKLVDRPGNRLYWLENHKIEWPLKLERIKDKFIFSDAQQREIEKTRIVYRYDDGTTIDFPLSKMMINFDLTASVGNFYKGVSRIDALHKIVSNSEHTLDSDNINIRYSGKFLVGARNETGTTNRLGLSEEEKKDIREKIDSMNQKVWPFRTNVELKRFVENMAQLQLSEKYLHTYFLIGNMYNIPRDVLEHYQSATYENQEKARAAHVNYTLDPKGNQFMDCFQNYFGYTEQGKNIYITWDHLPFMQVFEKERAEIKKIKIESLNSLLQMGVPLEEANEFLELDFTIEEKEDVSGMREESQGQGSESGQGGTNQEGDGSQESGNDESGDGEEVEETTETEQE